MNIFRPFFVVFEIKTQKWSSLKLVSFYLYKRMFYSCYSFLFFFLCVCIALLFPFSFCLLWFFPKSYYNKLQYKLTIMQKEDMETSMKMKLNHNCVIFFVIILMMMTITMEVSCLVIPENNWIQRRMNNCFGFSLLL